MSARSVATNTIAYAGAALIGIAALSFLPIAIPFIAPILGVVSSIFGSLAGFFGITSQAGTAAAVGAAAIGGAFAVDIAAETAGGISQLVGHAQREEELRLKLKTLGPQKAQ